MTNTQWINYQLPDGRIVQVAYDVCRAASTIDFTLSDGRIVLAVWCDGRKQYLSPAAMMTIVLDLSDGNFKAASGRLIDELTYSSYKYNREIAPHVTPERWRAIFPNAEAMERLFTNETDSSGDDREHDGLDASIWCGRGKSQAS